MVNQVKSYFYRFAMEELSQLASFFVANLYLEKKMALGGLGGDFMLASDHFIYKLSKSICCLISI